jgi:hypothetical protein
MPRTTGDPAGMAAILASLEVILRSDRNSSIVLEIASQAVRYCVTQYYMVSGNFKERERAT